MQKSWLRKCCIEIVSHKRFEMGCALLVILCAASIGDWVDGVEMGKPWKIVEKPWNFMEILVFSLHLEPFSMRFRAVSGGIESDYTIQNASAEQHIVFRALDISFNILFALELMVRWTAEGPLMFLSCENPAWKWRPGGVSRPFGGV